MTYREKIQNLINAIDNVYNDAEWLRDIATEQEKKYWNELRAKTYIDYTHPLRKLDESLSNERATMKIS